MTRGLLIALLLFVLPGLAQAQLTQSGVNGLINADILSCGTQCVSAQELRTVLQVMNSATFQAQGLNGLVLSGTPSVGWAPIATGATAAAWAPVALPGSPLTISGAWNFATAPTVPTAPAGTSTNQAASTAFINDPTNGIFGQPHPWSALQTFDGGAAVIGANTSGLTTDFGQFIVQNSATTAGGVYSGVSPFLYSDGTRSTVVVPSGTTVANGNGFGAYVLNRAASSGTSSNAVEFFGVGISAVDGAATWGLNPTCNDTTNNASAATANRQCNGFEFDCTLATNNSGSGCQGVSVILNGLFGEQKGGNAFQVAATGSPPLAHWTNSFVSGDGVTLGPGTSQGAALLVGALAKSGTNVNSQSILFNRRDGGGTAQQSNLTYSSTGTLNFSGLGLVAQQFLATGATSTVGVGQVSIGGTTVAAGSNTCPTGTVGTQTVQGCEVHNVAGTTRYVPFF